MENTNKALSWTRKGLGWQSAPWGAMVFDIVQGSPGALWNLLLNPLEDSLSQEGWCQCFATMKLAKLSALTIIEEGVSE